MAWRDRTWTTDGPNAQFGSSVFRSGGGGGLAPRSASIMEQGAQGADVLGFSLPGAVSPGAISLSNIVPVGTLQMNADGVTLEYGATLLLRNDATDVSFTATYTDATGLHIFAVSLAVQRLNVPAGGSFALEFDVLADETAPLLSTPISAKNGQNAFTGSVVTDEATGTLEFVIYLDTAPAPSVTQLEAGQDGNGAACPGGRRSQAVSVVGTQDVSGSGLTANTAYRIAFLHRDAATNPSGVVITAAFQTDAPPLSLLGTLTGFGVGSGSVTVDLTSLGLQQDDLVRVFVSTASNANRTIAITTSGYAALFSPKIDTADTYRVSANVFEKAMGASPDANVVVTAPGSSNTVHIVIVKAYRGARLSPTTDVTPALKTQGTNGIVIDPPSNTPVTDGTIIEYWGCGARIVGTADLYTSGDIADLVSGKHDSTGYTGVWCHGSRTWNTGGGTIDPAALTIAGSDATMSWACLSSTVSPA